MARRGTFRQDLLYRINTVEITLPPLRERDEDIPLLARHFLREFAAQYGKPTREISRRALERMRGYAWPGNVRELRHTLERGVILSEGEVLRETDLRFSAPLDVPEDEHALGAGSLDLETVEQAVVRRALSKHGGNISRAAEELGISRAALYRRIEKYGL